MSFKEVSSLRKEGKLSEALELAGKDYAASQDRWSASALFWVYYSILKSKNPESFGQLWEMGEKMLALSEQMEVDEIVSQSLENSLVHISSQCTRSCRTGSASEDLLGFLAASVKRFPDNVFLIRALAMARRSSGDNESALSLFRRVLKMKNDGYLWGELYDFVEDEAVRESALCKALLAQPKPEFTGKIRLKLSCVLIRAKDYGRAAYELKQYEDTYKRNSWHLSADYFKILRFIPSGTVPVKTGKQFYASRVSVAEAFVYQDIPTQVMVPLQLRSGKPKGGKPGIKRLVLADRKGRVVNVPLSKAGACEKDCMDRAYEVRSSKAGNGPRQIVSCVPRASFPEWKDEVRVFSGSPVSKKDRSGNAYCLVGECFVAPQMAPRLSPSGEATVVAVRKNGRWRATFIL